MNLINIIFIAIIGICIGSFINVCIYRIPLEKSIAFPNSFCPNCGMEIKRRDLIPILSYIILGGKCRNCKDHISIRYPLIELFTGMLFVLTFLKFGLTIQFAIYAIINSILIMIFFIDYDKMIIPDGLNLLVAILGITLNITYPVGGYKETVLQMLYGSLLGGGLFIIFAFFGAMGGGDIKLMAALGLLFKFKLIISLMFLSFVFGGIISIGLLAFKIKTMKDMIPFGPYIVIASIVTMFYGTEIVSWYLGNFFII